jgi:hypothetical protein
LQQGIVFPGLVELLLQRLCSKYCVAVSLEHVRFLSGPLHDIRHKTTMIIEYSTLWNSTTQGTATYHHPLLSTAHRLQVAIHSRRVDKVVGQQFQSVTASRCSSSHRRRMNWFRVLDLW